MPRCTRVVLRNMPASCPTDSTQASNRARDVAPTNPNRPNATLPPTRPKHPNPASRPSQNPASCQTRARTKLTPPTCRTPTGQSTGTRQTRPRIFEPILVLRPPTRYDTSAVVHSRSSSWITPDAIYVAPFPHRSPPRLLTGAACGGLGPPPAQRSRRAIPPSPTQLRAIGVHDLLHRTPSCARGAPQTRVRQLDQSSSRTRSVTAVG